MVIKNVIKMESRLVIVFDENGDQSPEYQGHYDDVKEKILRDAPADAIFTHIVTTPMPVKREDW